MNMVVRYSVLLLLSILMICSCKDSEEPLVDPTGNSFYKIYPENNEGLLASITDNENGDLHIYGNRLQDDQLEAKAIVFERENNDTLINMIYGDDNEIQFLYSESKSTGEKNNAVVRIDHIELDSIIVSIYEKDWSNNSSELVFQTTLTEKDSMLINQVAFIRGDFTEFNNPVATSVYNAIIVLAATGVGVLGATVGGPWLGVAGAYTIATAGGIIGTACAAEPVYPEEEPTGVPDSPSGDSVGLEDVVLDEQCLNVLIPYTVEMDEDDGLAVLIDDWNVGTGPYEYAIGWEMNFQEQFYFEGPYESGESYPFIIRDANGCLSSRVIQVLNPSSMVDLTEGEWNLDFSNSSCDGMATMSFNNDGSITFANPGLNEDVTSSTYTLNNNMLSINHIREYVLCTPSEPSESGVVTESWLIELTNTDLNNFSGTFSITYSGNGLTNCNATDPSCSGTATVSK